MPCSKCRLSGHNVRTCPVKRAELADKKKKSKKKDVPVIVIERVIEHENEECPVCLCELRDANKLTTISCNHSFCIDCVEKMHKKRIERCPLCRTNHNYTYDKRKYTPHRKTLIKERIIQQLNTILIPLEERFTNNIDDNGGIDFNSIFLTILPLYVKLLQYLREEDADIIIARARYIINILGELEEQQLQQVVV